MKIAHYTPTLAYGDAVGNDLIAIHNIVRVLGYESEIYCSNLDPKIKDISVSWVNDATPPLSESDILVFHIAIYWDEPADRWLKCSSCRKIAVYHNITPSKYFIDYTGSEYECTKRGLQMVRESKGVFDYCLAVSQINKDDLLSYGWTCPIDVLPIIIPFEDYEVAPDAKTIRQYSDGATNLLFVGRLAPNKKQEDVVTVFWQYHRRYNPNSRLFLVGSEGDYGCKLRQWVMESGIQNVIFANHVPFNEILAYYKIAHVFICMSEHEGFCVPLVEAMFFDVPIVARATTAIPDTLGGSGVLIPEYDTTLTAGIIDALMTRPELRQQIIAKQRERLSDFAYEKIKGQFTRFLTGFLAIDHKKN
jgi:glycosyltransferase involved in cell wall biosynthesis